MPIRSSKAILFSFVILLPLSPVSKAGGVLTVGPGADYATISEAVAAAQPGDTIEVSAGQFAEAVVLDKPLTVLGANQGNPAGMVAGIRGPETTLEGGFRILPAAAGSTISGFLIKQGLDEGGVRAGVRIDAAEVRLRDSIISGVGTLPVAIADSYGICIASGGTGALIFNNRLSDNVSGIVAENVGMISISGNLVENHQVAGVRLIAPGPGITLRENGFIGNLLAVTNQGTETVDARENFWNSGEVPPLLNAPNGPNGPVVISPWYADISLQTLVCGILEDTTIGMGESVDAKVLYVAQGVTYKVDRGHLAAGRLDLQDGAVLEVIDGDLVLQVPGGGDHTIAGTFRITHCLGSIEILSNTTFSGSTLGLVSDFHLADGVVLSVTGSLKLDGCRLSGDGGFTVEANVGSELEMTRCDVSGGAFFLSGNDVRLVDNAFLNSTVTVFGSVSGGSIYHNVFSGGDGDLEISPDAVVNTLVEEWGNVETVADAKNRMTLQWQTSVLPGRTLDGDGNLYVRPGDPVRVDLDSGAYTARVQAAEMLLAYHSGHLTLQGFSPLSPWENKLYFLDQPLSVLGKVDAAAGFGFNLENPDGTLNDHVIGDFEFTTGLDEGRTLVFFRQKEASDNPLIDTRLTISDGGQAGYLEYPFTRNSGTLTIDGTPPLIEDSSVTASQDQGGAAVDVFQSGVFTRIGTVGIGFDAFDALAGINSASVSVALEGPVVLEASFLDENPIDLNGREYTHYSFESVIDGSVPDGLYDATAVVTDLSGNTVRMVLGTIDVSLRIALVEVECQGLTTTPLTRAVGFAITDAGGVLLETRTGNVEFLGHIGSVLLTGLPADAARISAKTAWTLRRSLPCVFDAAGDARVSFVGALRLRGGDLDGNNIINRLDYGILNNNWFTINSVADISGDGVVNGADYNILNSNWYTAGDPE